LESIKEEDENSVETPKVHKIVKK